MADIEKGQVPAEEVPLTATSPTEPIGVATADDQMNECYTKEQLMELSDTKCWNLTRKVLLALFWLVWVAAIVWSVIIVAQAPKCKPEPEEAWFTKGALASIKGMLCLKN